MNTNKGESGILSNLSIDFAVNIISLYNWLSSEHNEHVLSKQVLRSGTSIGANIHEANYAASRQDFTNKLQIALKEAGETEYWFVVLKRSGYLYPELSTLHEQLLSIKRLLIKSINTAKGNH